MTKKYVKIIIVIIILLIAGYFSYKGYNFYNYYLSAQKFDDVNSNFEITDTMTISNDKTIDYITFDEVKMVNDFKNFDKVNTQGDFIVSYQQSNENGNNNTFSYAKGDEKVSNLINFSSATDKKINKINAEEIFKKYDIKNDLDLIKYLSTWDFKKMNIFTRTFELKKNYFFNYIKNTEYPGVEKILLLEGKYQGYILYYDDFKEINILKNNKNYMFLFSGEKFTNEYIKYFLDTLVID